MQVATRLLSITRAYLVIAEVWLIVRVCHVRVTSNLKGIFERNKSFCSLTESYATVFNIIYDGCSIKTTFIQ